MLLIKLSKKRLTKSVIKEAPTQVFPCEYCKIFKNNYFEDHPQMDEHLSTSKVRINKNETLESRCFVKQMFSNIH